MNIMDMPSPTDAPPQEDTPDLEQNDPVEKNDLQEVLKDFWATKPTTECVQMLVKKASAYYEYVSATGKMALWRLCFEQYNRGYVTLGSISRGGVEGELVNLPINEFRNIADHIIGMTTQEKLAYEGQPINNDYQTAAQVLVAKGIINYYAKHKGMDMSRVRRCENAYIFGEGSTLKLWNENIGDLKMVDVVGQKIYRNGDCQFIDLNPTNLIRDINVHNFGDNNWFIVRLFVNKYDLAVQYPDKAKDICDRTSSSDWDNSRLTSNHSEDSDMIPLFLYFHKPTPAIPFGRQIFYIDGDCWLEDGHLKYRSLEDVVVTMMPSPVESINFGYTTAFDIMPIQMVLDILAGGVATNVTNFVVTNILVPDGCDLGVADLIGSMNLLKYNAQAGKPEALNLVLTPPEVYALWDRLIQRAETIAGINAQIRGAPDENITSGSQSALQDTRAIRFNSRFAHADAECSAKLATAVLHDLQDHPEELRTGLIAGKSNKSYMKEFSGQDVAVIDRFTVELGSAFMQTEAGKLQVAQDLLNSPTGLDPKEFLNVVETGQLSSLTEGPERELMLIKQENEVLSDGGVCKAVMTDDHLTHIKEHKNVIADPGLRMSNDPKMATIVQNTLTHIGEHQQLLSTMPPTLAAILGLPVLGGQAAPPQPGGGPPHPQPGVPPPHTGAPSSAPGRPAPKPQAPPPQGKRPAPQAKMPLKPGLAARPSVAVPNQATPPVQPQGGIRA